MLCISALASCKSPETTEDTTNNSQTSNKNDSSATEERFDYLNADLSKYITVKPEIYKNLTLEIEEKYEVTDKLLEEYIKEILGNYPNITEVTDRPIKKGDTVYIHYEGYINGELFAGGSNMSDKEPYPLTIGSGKFIDGFEDGLIGVIPAETSKENPAEVNCRFPDNYGSADVAGKDAVFKVVVSYIAEESPVTELTEEFVLKNFTFDPAKGDVIEQFMALAIDDLNTSFRTVALGEIYDLLAGKFEIKEYPEVEVNYYFNYYKSQFESSYSQYTSNKSYYASLGLIFNNFDEFACYYAGIDKGSDWQAYVTEKCKLYIEETLFVYAIVQNEGKAIDQERYNKSLDYLVKYYILYYENNYGYTFSEEQVKSMITFENVMDHAITELFLDIVLENATITYVPTKEETTTGSTTNESNTEATTTEEAVTELNTEATTTEEAVTE